MCGHRDIPYAFALFFITFKSGNDSEPRHLASSILLFTRGRQNGHILITIYSCIIDVEDAVDFLHGLRHRNETENGAMQYASMAGGMEIFIDGAGFDEQAHINTVMFESKDIEDLILAGPSLDSRFTYHAHKITLLKMFCFFLPL